MDAILQQEVALMLLKNLGSSSRSARDRGREPANYSEAAMFSPSPGKFKPRKFAKTDVVVRYADSLVKLYILSFVCALMHNYEYASSRQ
ncbi:hypothetical protein E2C01_014496 [Portunus trituberculatus]|uniref:Uncharacterized protein n=1 Tax=Portunus trituberculatus TaxID=210409 RepID=A0A5B7DK76_PORTR|nr:hypothetical protein [Portunus trituberculatus]